MKLGPILLLNALITGAAIFTYDVVKGDAAPADTPTYEMGMTADPAPKTGDDYTPEPSLQGIGDEVWRAKVGKHEAEIASLKELLAKLTAKGGSSAAASGSDGPVASLDLPIVNEGDEDPEFDEDTLRSLRKMMEQVEQQRRNERVVEGVKRQLDRLGIELSDDQEKGVIDATMGYRTKMGQMWRELPRGNDDETREKRKEAFDGLREEYSKTVYSLVPAADAEKIVGGMGRSTGGFDMGGRGRPNRRGR